MKMTQEHYQFLEAKVKAIGAAKINAHREFLKTVNPPPKDPEKRLLWEAFHACQVFRTYDYQSFDYQDSHIETAMKKILKELT